MSGVRIVEVGPRDGLQNERTPVPTDVKLRFIQRLVDAGLTEIEATSFVSPKWVPQLADADQLWRSLPDGPTYWALVPNSRGLERAQAVGAGNIAVITAASDAFTARNMNMTVAESLDAIELMAQRGGRLRAYVSTAFECPYAGRIAPEKVVNVLRRLVEIGIQEISLGDTIGAATPNEVVDLTSRIRDELSLDRIAYHFHDTRGTAIANVAKAIELGVRTFDSSSGGLGGCPYAPGAGGNLATEDLLYFLQRQGVPTPMSLEKVAAASIEVLEVLGRQPESKAQRWSLTSARSCPK